ncbi:RNA polymerase sigma factor (sigma-70 family) [Bradyrhizobium sp. USDA 4341]
MKCGRHVVRKSELPEPADALALLSRWQSGDAIAGELLAEAFHSFVESVARRQRRGHLQHQDLVQEGRLALIQALLRYNITLTTAPLPVYVASCVQARIKRYVMDYLGPVRPTGDADRAAFYSNPELRPTAVEMSDDLASELAEEAPAVLAEERLGVIEKCLAALSPRERDIVVRTKFAEEPTSLADIARESGVSRQTVHGLDRRAMDKMRTMLVDVMRMNLECLV